MSNPTTMQYLVLSALGHDRPGIINQLAEAARDTGCNIVDSRMTVLGGEFALLMMVEGNWNGVAKLEQALPTLERRLELTIICRRTEEQSGPADLLPYTVEVVTIDHPGIISQLAGFFAGRNINIRDLYTDSYRAAHTGTQMFSATMTVHIPKDIHIARLREEFLDLCDALNLDAVIEPQKG